ncbi:MAG: response regulator transcription factor [Anaerolineales bacterium]|nr:response regulator transcription factor [Anaerolineales bacterium]
MTNRLRVFLVEDQPVSLNGLQLWIEDDGDLELAGVARRGREALAQIPKLNPEVVVLDYELPDINGAEVIRRLREVGFCAPILIFSGHNELEFIQKAFSAGAKGYVLKMEDSIFLLQAIRIVAQGGTCSSSSLANVPGVPPSAGSLERQGNKLYAREWETLSWLAKGCTNREIAVRMCIAEVTVRFHLRKIYQKLNLNRGEAIAWAVRKGLGNQ